MQHTTRSLPLGAALLLLAGSAAAGTFSVTGSGSTFTITRSGDTNAAETVRYRTVPLTAFPGQHYTKMTGRVLKCYTNDGDSLSLYVGNNCVETVSVVDHIAEFAATNFPSGVEIRVEGATTSDTVTFQ